MTSPAQLSRASPGLYIWSLEKDISDFPQDHFISFLLNSKLSDSSQCLVVGIKNIFFLLQIFLNSEQNMHSGVWKWRCWGLRCLKYIRKQRGLIGTRGMDLSDYQSTQLYTWNFISMLGRHWRWQVMHWPSYANNVSAHDVPEAGIPGLEWYTLYHVHFFHNKNK